MFKPNFRVAKVDANYLLVIRGSFSLALILIYPRVCIIYHFTLQFVALVHFNLCTKFRGFIIG